MKIYINNELIDIKLEKEKTFHDLFMSMQEEAQKHNKFIIDFKFDLKNPTVRLEKENDLPLDVIDSVYFYIGDLKEMILSTLQTQNQYIDDIGSKLFESEHLTEQDVQHLKEGAKWISEVISIITGFFILPLQNIQVKMPEKNYENLVEHLNKFLELVKQLNTENYPNFRMDLIKSLRVIRAFTFQYFNQLLSNQLSNQELLDTLETFEANIDNLKNDLVEINTNLQVGSDKLAMIQLEELLKKLELYFFVLMTTVERLKKYLDEEMVETFKDLLIILEDLSSALMENDIVAVGDILEYELNDKLTIIKENLPQLKKLLTNDVSLEN
jgi:hypothetical protein